MKVWHFCIVIGLLCYLHFTAGKAVMEVGSNRKVVPQDVTYSKREADILEEDDHRLSKSYPKFKRRRSPFGVVYKDGKPIGILEPISRIYEYQNFPEELSQKNSYKRNMGNPAAGDEAYVKRDTDRSESDNVLRSFRMNPHFQDQPVKNEQKRNARAPLKHKDAVLGDTKLSAIEHNLKEIISDLNTISTDDDGIEPIDKRDVLAEDEDLDKGDNKIGLTKETPAKQVSSKSVATDSVKEKKSVDARNEQVIADYRNEGESYIRQKRQQAKASKQDDIIKDLEVSGELTVSGNKSPLASASAPVEAESKKGKGGDFEKRDKQASDDLEDEKRLQRNIQTKISEIKDEVKREIQALASNPKPAISEPEASVRQRRNLLEQETNNFDLAKNSEPGSLASHIRQKRGALDDTLDDANIVEEHSEFIAEDLKPVAKNNDAVKRDALGFGQQVVEQSRPAALNSAGEEKAPARHVNAMRSVDAVGGLDAAKLEKLVKESATLTESIRYERAASKLQEQHAPHVEPQVAQTAPPPAAKRDTQPKSTTRKGKLFRNSEARTESNANIEEAEAVSDTSPSPAQGGRALKYKAFEASTKMSAKEDDSATAAGSEHVAVEAHTELNSKLVADDAGQSEESARAGPEETAHLAAEHNVPKRESRSSENGDPSKGKASHENKVRQQRKTDPVLSLEDMQTLDSENSMRRRRRRRFADEYGEEEYGAREKRADYDAPSMQFRTYRGDEDEADDESDEFDDDNFDDRTANLVRKRAAQQQQQQQQVDAYDDLVDDGDYEQPPAARMSKRNANARDYVAQMNDDASEESNYLYDANGRPLNRFRRQIIDDVAALHGGGPTVNHHLAAIRERNTRTELAPSARASKPVDKSMISSLSESDIFGALPQSYEGELTRFKRVKRDDPAG